MRTPVEAVHLGVFGREALRKLVIAMILAIPARGISGRQQHDDPSPDKRIPPLWGRLAGVIAFLLTFSPLFRHGLFYITVVRKHFCAIRFTKVRSMQPVLRDNVSMQQR